MDLIKAKRIANDLIGQHGLYNWQFCFSRSRKAIGACSYRNKFIKLSREFTRINKEDAVMDTLLHEIAHALTPGAGHGREWKRKCRLLGCTPRSNTSDIVMPKAPYEGSCNCETMVWRQYGKPRLNYFCCKCKQKITYCKTKY